MLAQSQRAASPGAVAGAGAPRPMTMEELERDMMQNLRVAPPQAPAPQQTAPGTPGSAPQSGFIGSQQLQLQQEAVRPPLPSSHSQQSFMQPRQGQSMPPGPFALGGGVGATAPLPPAAAPAPGLAAGPMFPPLAPAQPGLLGALNQPQQPQQPQQPAPPMTEEQVTLEMERKIMETEMAEGKRRRKAQKIAGMARYNDIMTGGESGGQSCMRSALRRARQATRNSSRAFSSPSSSPPTRTNPTFTPRSTRPLHAPSSPRRARTRTCRACSRSARTGGAWALASCATGRAAALAVSAITRCSA